MSGNTPTLKTSGARKSEQEQNKEEEGAES
jgi:hypothetical protein